MDEFSAYVLAHERMPNGDPVVWLKMWPCDKPLPTTKEVRQALIEWAKAAEDSEREEVVRTLASALYRALAEREEIAITQPGGVFDLDEVLADIQAGRVAREETVINAKNTD